MRFKQSSIFCLFFYVFVLVGCSSLHPKEEIIQGNIFKLDYPKLILDVSDEMTYAGKHEATNRDSYNYGPKESITIEKNYIFSSDKKLSKGVFISIRELVDRYGYWMPIRVKKTRKDIFVEQNAIKLSGKTWQTWTIGYTPDKNTIAATDALLLSPGPYNIAKVYARVAGPNRKRLIIVAYIEDITENVSEILQYQRTRTFSDKGYKYLEGFIERAENSVVFIE